MFKSSLSLAAMLAALVPSAAFACGGFFCSAQPVDQQAERILFAEEADGRWSAFVEIQYQGDAESFAWVVPVPEAPELDTWDGTAFNALDQATQPSYQPDQQCLPPAAFAADGDGAGGGQNAPEREGGVQVLAREQVGPFDTVTVKSDDPRELVEWLRTNDFRIVPEMEPFIALYTEEGMAFTAMKLLPGEDVDAIKPIKMTYRSAGPVVPLRLTSIAAMPEMGVKVWVLGAQRFGPENVPSVEVPDEEIVFDYNRFQTNYLSLVARKIDEAGGHGFVTEYAQPTENLLPMIQNSGVPGGPDSPAAKARDELIELLQRNPYVTRLYTRLSPEEMDIDPLFGPAEGEDVSNIHQLEDPTCGGEQDAPQPCAFQACGAGGHCGVAEAGAGCACAEGAVARVVPGSQPRVSCVDLRLNFAALATLDVGVISLPNPCEGNDMCGANGECLSLNGSATCRCAQGFIAVTTFNEEGMATPTCAEPTEAIPAEFYREAQLPEPNLPYPGRRTPIRGGVAGTGGGGMGGCSSVPGAPHSSWWLLTLLPLALRRRR